jgi:hypothetical protein
MILSMPEGMVSFIALLMSFRDPISYFCDFIDPSLIRILNVVECAGSVVIAQYAVCHFFVKAVKTTHSLFYGLGTC